METYKKIGSILTTVLVAIIVAVAIFLMGSRLIGFDVYNVISGSMEPEYSVGDLLYVKSVDPEDVQVGDDITFVLNEQLQVATHRVINVEKKQGTNDDGQPYEYYLYYTKGLANKDPDQTPVHSENLIGTPVFAIPLLGYVSDYIQHPPGTYVAIGAMILLILLAFLPDLIGLSKKNKAEEELAKQRSDLSAELDAQRAESEQMKAELEALRAQMANAAPEQTPSGEDQ
jgi:signal peptidase